MQRPSGLRPAGTLPGQRGPTRRMGGWGQAGPWQGQSRMLPHPLPHTQRLPRTPLLVSGPTQASCPPALHSPAPGPSLQVCVPCSTSHAREKPSPGTGPLHMLLLCLRAPPPSYHTCLVMSTSGQPLQPAAPTLRTHTHTHTALVTEGLLHPGTVLGTGTSLGPAFCHL